LRKRSSLILCSSILSTLHGIIPKGFLKNRHPL
jgi:hypothetical protein